eukprot:jgi/Mesen1/7727/ME000407S06943
MDPEKFRSQLSDIAFGDVLGAAARDYKKELLATEKAKPAKAVHEDVDLDDLLDDPELEKLHKQRIFSMKVTEDVFLQEVTSSDNVVCHFYHREFVRCKIVDKHIKILAIKHLEAKFIKVDAEKCPFFVAKLAIKVLPCIILFKNGVSIDRIIGFEELGGVDDFATGVIQQAKKMSEEDTQEARQSSIRVGAYADSDSD